MTGKANQTAGQIKMTDQRLDRVGEQEFRSLHASVAVQILCSRVAWLTSVIVSLEGNLLDELLVCSVLIDFNAHTNTTRETGTEKLEKKTKTGIVDSGIRLDW